MTSRDLPTPKTETLAAISPTKKKLADRIPVLAQLRQSVGLQRGMLVVGLVIVGIFLLTALLDTLIAPYGFAQQKLDGVSFGTQQATN